MKASRPPSPAQASGAAKFVGAKGGAGVWQQIISQMPPHSVYVELFLGTGVILRRKRPALTSYAMDIDPQAIAAFRARPELIPGLKLEQGDALEWLRSGGGAAWGSDCLIYCDPPYLLSTRGHRCYYEHEFSDLQHVELLRLLKAQSCNVIISGYTSELYSTKLRGWRTHSFYTTTRGGGRVKEWLWMNFPEPFELFDTRFLGQDFRERERIKRKRNRWANRLLTMSRLDRAAILEAISDARAKMSTAAAPSLKRAPSL